jgi:hypothetical protein
MTSKQIAEAGLTNIIRVSRLRLTATPTYIVVCCDGTKRRVENHTWIAGYKKWNISMPGEREAYDAADTLMAALSLINTSLEPQGKPLIEIL